MRLMVASFLLAQVSMLEAQGTQSVIQGRIAGTAGPIAGAIVSVVRYEDEACAKAEMKVFEAGGGQDGWDKLNRREKERMISCKRFLTPWDTTGADGVFRFDAVQDRYTYITAQHARDAVAKDPARLFISPTDADVVLTKPSLEPGWYSLSVRRDFKAGDSVHPFPASPEFNGGMWQFPTEIYLQLSGRPFFFSGKEDVVRNVDLGANR